MYKITAINEETDTEDEDDTKVTKEAEETIVMSEYMRALQMQKENSIDDALSLFSELLETQVLFEVTEGSTHTAKTLLSIKYNCCKNIGFIHNDRNNKETALEFLLKAIELDDTDVYTLNKLGQIALQMKQLDIAQMAFEKCLKQNANHWPSGDGILQILCMQKDYNEAYGWALMWYNKNPNYARGLQVILEIREKFDGLGLDFIENSWSIIFKNRSLKRTHKQSVFPEVETVSDIPLVKPDLEDFKIESFETLNWLTLGEFIAKLYNHLSIINDGVDIDFMFSHTDFLLKQVKVEPPRPENDIETPIDTDVDMDADNNVENDAQMQENSDSNGANNNPEAGNSVDGNTEDSTQDAPTTSEDGSKQAAKPKSSRRRGSDLKLLEPWCYWDRNRKQSQRQKNKQIERMENDASINGILRKILPKYFEKNFDDESPFHPEDATGQYSSQTSTNSDSAMATQQTLTLEMFQEQTAGTFSELIKEIEENSLSVIALVTKWVQCVSKFWEQKIPSEILDLYLKIYRYYLNHYDVTTWNLLEKTEFQTAFRMALFYLELSHHKSMTSADMNSKNEVNEEWFILFHQLIFQSGFHEFDDIQEEATKYQKRLQWLQYCLSRYEYDLCRSVNYLESIRDLCIANDDTSSLTLPNQKLFSKIDIETINETIVMLERTINLNSVKQFYDDHNYQELIEILKDSIINTTKSKNTESSVMKIRTQFEIILECFWNLEMFDDCLIWCERCLKYALDHFIGSSKDSAAYKEWSTSINFILTYIEALILNESYMIVNCLQKYYARLIQSITRIVTNQLDGPQEKNTNHVNPIDLKMPWVILHHILQREEDMKPHPKRKLSNGSSASTDKDSTEEEVAEVPIEDEIIPNSIAIFFTAHEYLGNRAWCTKDKGRLLLNILEVVVPRLRTPCMEPFRDIIAEYLEQVTYCLYGYPAKRARLKHIEEHDAQNIDLEWSHAVQLYDLYRPDDLPGFDSYKSDSIQPEMEQLLQRILAIIPPEIDPSTHSGEMEKFIGGELDELPKPLDILPYRVNSIYYLLADHYLKYRDIPKAVKYYALDLSNCPTRFDAWAGLALSKASIMETKLNACATIPTKEWIQQSEEVLRCFKQCLEIDAQMDKLWIEYGSYAYALHSYCSRCLKQSSHTLSMEKFSFLEEKKEESMKIAHECFTTLDKSKNADVDEKWLVRYMLGKLSEKRKEPSENAIEHYLKSAEYLYEHNATYPFKIIFTDLKNLSLEALELFYRITAAIIKYMEQHSTITKAVGRYFIKVLKQQAKCPFAMNQAKINENSVNDYKRKMTCASQEAAKQKMAKIDATSTPTHKFLDETKESENSIVLPSNDVASTSIAKEPEAMETDPIPTADEKAASGAATEQILNPTEETDELNDKMEPLKNPNVTNVIDENLDSPSRRGSQESTATTTTQTTTTTSTDSTSSTSSESDSSTSSSDDDSSSEDDSNKDENAPLDEKRIDIIYRMCIKNLEECVTRFPEHYKSIYRLVMIYMNGPERIKNVEKCNQLLLGTYTTELGNQIQGLFTDRKNNNLFNGIWRNPSSEIDRPGSFSSHLSKCVNILMQILRINLDYKLLLEIIFHLQRVPDADKRYIKDSERKELLELAMTFCVQSFKDLLKRHSVENPDDSEILILIVEIFKAHRKCSKNASQKESPFSGVLVDTYKAYIQGKVLLPENVNYLELATKLCLFQINPKKNQDKQPTGKRHSLDELGFGGLAASLSKLNNSFSGPVGVRSASPSLPISIASTTNVVKTSVPTITTITTTASISSNITNTVTATTPMQMPATMSTFIPGVSRPRGRPAGSKNLNPKSNESKKKPSLPQMPISSIPSIVSSLLKPINTSPFAGSLPDLKLITAHLEPSVRSAIMMLLAEPNFMNTLAQFQDPTSMNTFLSEYFRLSQNMAGFPSSPQLMSGFVSVLNCLATSMQPSTSIPNLISTQTKVPKMDTGSLLSKSSAMSIFPTSSKSTISTSAISAKQMTTNSTTITPVATPSTGQPSSLLKSAASTIISVGSGQLTITPSISITPNPPQTTSMQAPLMQIPNFVQAKPKSALPKVKGKPGPKPGSKHSSKTGMKPGPKPKNQMQFPNFPVDLPKSLSITPSSSGLMPPMQLSSSSMSLDMLTKKVPKETKPRKKSLEGSTKINKQSNIPAPKASTMSKASLNQQILLEQINQYNQYKELLRTSPNGPNYISQFEQFLSIANPSDILKTAKAQNVTGSMISEPKASIKVKQLDQLLGTSNIPKPVQKTNKTVFTPPPSGLIKNQTMTNNAAVLNAFGTTISSLSHTSQQQLPLPFSTMLASSASLPSSSQISPTKTLQQKLAERQKQFNDANSPSRPSSTSSAGSAKTRKSDTDVIILD